MIDRTCRYPVNISIAESEETKCGYIRNLRFTAFNSRTGYFPMLVGREENYLEDITFDRCRFEITERADKGFIPRYVRNLKMDCEWHVK